jgi:predicted N-acetyltransferase YhbS
MGKNFPRIISLKEDPSFLGPTLKLIERSFLYKKPNSFEIDFFPLINESNHQNCFILVGEDEGVIAHIGVKEKNLLVKNELIPVAMLGGIAVDEKFRGEGHFQTLMNDVLAEKRSDVAFFLLWSDMEKLYNKFGFHLCGKQVELSETNGPKNFLKTKFKDLSSDEKLSVETLFRESFSKLYLTLERTPQSWEEIANVTSADLFIKKTDGVVTDYFFMNKGQDLPGIIYEYGTKGNLEDLVGEISRYGKVWMGEEFVPSESIQYQFFMCPGDLKLFSRFISHLTENKVSIRNINPMKQEVFFDFNEELYSLEVPEFLRGVFGPGTFEELDLKPIFISGLESI